MNRGVAKQSAPGEGPAAAITDYDQAIILMEGLRASLEPTGRWIDQYRNDLATAYVNRGVVKNASKLNGDTDLKSALRICDAILQTATPEARARAHEIKKFAISNLKERDE